MSGVSAPDPGLRAGCCQAQAAHAARVMVLMSSQQSTPDPAQSWRAQGRRVDLGTQTRHCCMWSRASLFHGGLFAAVAPRHFKLLSPVVRAVLSSAAGATRCV